MLEGTCWVPWNLGQSDKRAAMLLAARKFPLGACLKSKKKLRKEKNKRSSRNFKMRKTPPHLYLVISVYTDNIL